MAKALMYKILSILFLVMTLYAAKAQDTLTKRQGKEDLRFLYKAIVKTHPVFLDKKEIDPFRKGIDSIAENLPREFSTFYLWKQIAPCLNSRYNGHTGFEPIPFAKGIDSYRLLPFLVYRQGEEVFIGDALDSSLENMQLISIDSEPIQVVYEWLIKSSSYDNPALMPKLINSSFPVFY